MPRRQTVSARQSEIVVDFLETHRELAMGRIGGPMGSQASRQAWQNLALKLNSLGDGVEKTWEQWRRYWVEWKCRTRTKAADSRRMMRGTGGGPNRLEPLSSLEERILALIGNVAVEGLPDVRVPLDESSPILNSLDVQVLEETTVTAVAPEIQSINTNIGIYSGEPFPVQRQEIVEPQAPLSPVLVPDSQAAVLEDHAQATPSTAIMHTFNDIPTQVQDIPTETSRSTQPRRRRRQNRPIFQDTNVPRWAYELEERRLANEERIAAALHNLSAQFAEIVASLNKIVVAIENK